MRHTLQVRLLGLCLLVLAGILLPGCKDSPLVSPLESPVSPLPPATTSQLSVGESPLVEPEPFVVPTPSADTAIVWGQIVDDKTGLAPFEGAVALGGVLSMDSGVPVVSLHRNEAPRAKPTTDGWFAISDVTPGEYGVVFYTPDISFLLDDGAGHSLMIELEPGEIVDLGRIEITLP